jgi:hypothetical protein
MNDFSSSYKYVDKLLDIERSIVVLKEMKKFDFVSYLIYYDKELSDEQKSTKINIETANKMLDSKVSAKFEYEGFKKMDFIINTDTKIDENYSIAITSDAEGKNLIKRITHKNITDNNTSMSIYSNFFYLHYPYNPPRIVSFGEGYDYKLGNNNTSTTYSPSEVDDFTGKVRQIENSSYYTVLLDEDNIIHYTGYKCSLSSYHYTMKKYEK